MMQYLLLCRFDEDAWNAIPEAERFPTLARGGVMEVRPLVES